MTTTNTGHAVRREEDVPAIMRDGTILRADVYRPQGTGPFPVALLRTPYNKKHPREIAHAEELASFGYIVAMQDMRGRHASDGEYDLHFGPGHGDDNILDGYDTVEWAANLPDSAGTVGTWGVSHMAWTQWKLAPTRPPHLRAMFAGGVAPDSRVAGPGIFQRDRRLQWWYCTIAPDTRRRLGLPGPKTVEEAQTAWDSVERGKWLWFEPMCEFPEEFSGGLYKFWHYYLARQHCNLYRLDGKYHEIDVPNYHATSWYDRMWSCLDLYHGMIAHGRTEMARKSQKLIIGPWPHGFEFIRKVGAVDFGPEAERSSAQLIARWFDYWLKGIDNGIMKEPLVSIFVMGENKWRYENEWPLARTVYTDYYFHSGGHANTPFGDGVLSPERPAVETPDTYVYDPRDPVMSIHLPGGGAGPGDMRSHNYRKDILVYQTPPLERETEVTGPIVATLYTATSALDTDWTVRLTDVHPDGLAVNLSFGIVRARYRESFDNSTLLEPGRVYEYKITVGPTSMLFKAGHRIRVDISSSDFPMYDRNHNTGLNCWEDPTFMKARQTIFHDPAHPTRILLPIVPRP